MSSGGFVTVAPSSRSSRTSRRRRNKDKTLKSSVPSTTATTAAPAPVPSQSAASSSPVKSAQIASKQLPAKRVPTASSNTSARSEIVNKNGSASAMNTTKAAAAAATTAAITTTTTTTTANASAKANNVTNSASATTNAPSSVWDRRKKARAQNKPKNAAKPIGNTASKAMQSSTMPASKPSVAGSSGLSSQRRGFGSRRRIAHVYDPNSVDMNRKIPQRPAQNVQNEQESFPTLQQANAKKQKPAQSASASSAPSAPSASSASSSSKLRKSSGFRAKNRTAVQYNPDSVDMTRKPPPREIRSDVAAAGGLSSRSMGFRAKRKLADNVRPTSNASSSNSSVSVSSLTFGRGSRRYVPPQIRDLSDRDRTKIIGTKNKDAANAIDNKAIEKRGGSNTQIALSTTPKSIQSKPKPNDKPEAKPTAIVTPKRKRAAPAPNNVSPAKSARSTQSNSSRSSTSSTSSKKKSVPLQLSGDTKKYLEMRTQKKIKDVFLIKRETKNLHDVASIKTELTKKIAETDDTASNEYYYNKDDMLDFVENADFNTLNDTSVEVTHEKDGRLKSTVEAYNPYNQTVTTPTATMTPTANQTPTSNVFGAIASDVYAQDGLPAAATNPAYGLNAGCIAAFDDASNELMMMEDNKNIMIPTHAPGQHGQDINNIAEPFPGMLPNVPIITDRNEIARNAEIANRSQLRPMVDEFVPGASGAISGAVQSSQIQTFPSNQAPLMNQFGGNQFVAPHAAAAPTATAPPAAAAAASAASTNPMTQFSASTMLQFNRNTAVSNQQWVNNEQQQQQHHGAAGFKPHHNRYGGRDNRNPRRQYNSARNNNSNQRRYSSQRYNNVNSNNPGPRYNRNNQRYPRDNRNKYGQFQRRDRMRPQQQPPPQMLDHPHPQKVFQKSLLDSEDKVETKLDAKILPSWAFGEETDGKITDVYDENGKLMVPDIYLNFLCSTVSDKVFEFLTFREITTILVPIFNKRLYRRLRETAPVFDTLSISDWNVEIKSGTASNTNTRADNQNEDKFMKYIGNRDVLCRKGLFAYANRNGLRAFHISFSKSLSDWLCCINWMELKEYLQSATNLDTVIIGGCDANDVSEINKFATGKLQQLSDLFAHLQATKTFIVESAPFDINKRFITNLSTTISDLRLFSNKIKWDREFLESIRNQFGHLQRFGFPASCISQSSLSMPTMIGCIEGSVNELIIKNTQKHKSRHNCKQLQKQDLAILFERFEMIEIDSSLIEDYPSIKNQTRIKTISIEADIPNFFINLLKQMPCSVTHLIIKNSTYSTNSLVIDVSQKSKYNTSNIDTLTLYGFENNIKQIQYILTNNFFPKLETLNIQTKKIKNNLRLAGFTHDININITYNPSKY